MVRPPREFTRPPPRVFTIRPRPLGAGGEGARLAGEGVRVPPKAATPACLIAAFSFALSAILIVLLGDAALFVSSLVSGVSLAPADAGVVDAETVAATVVSAT